MTVVMIDVNELLSLSNLIGGDAVELEALANGSSGWLTPDGGDPELAAVRARIAAVVPQLFELSGSVSSVASGLAAGAQAGLASEGITTPFVGSLQPTMQTQWPPLLQGILGAPVGAPTAGFSGFLGQVTALGLLGQGIGSGLFGTTTNPGLNDLLNTASGAQGVLAGTGILPPAIGGDINAQALAISSAVGVQHAFNGTGPLFANGAIAGIHNSLGIVFPAPGGSTIGWALSLLGPHHHHHLAHHMLNGGHGIMANPFFNNPTGSVGELLTGPSLATTDTPIGPSAELGL